MFDGSDPCWIPRVPITDKSDWRLRKAQFGDGYEQRILDGLNALNQTWDLEWDSRPKADLLAMDSYLTSVKGAAFTFQHPVTLINYSVFCDSWQIDWNFRRKGVDEFNPEFYGTLTAEFYRANGASIGPITT